MSADAGIAHEFLVQRAAWKRTSTLIVRQNATSVRGCAHAFMDPAPGAFTSLRDCVPLIASGLHQLFEELKCFGATRLGQLIELSGNTNRYGHAYL